ncbi:MAG: histidine phosphatase family protein [Pseudohongiellaceae bacterium]
MELHLFRHGQSGWNVSRRVQGHSESRLTDAGVEQARELGRRVKAIGFDRVYCSSSQRTRQTARYMFGGEAEEICYRDALREIFLGPWEGRLYEDVKSHEPDSFHHFWHQPHLFNVLGAESFYDLQKRAVAAVGDIYSECAGQTVALVSHGAWIKTVLAHFQALDMSELWTPPHLHNCAHSIIHLHGGGNGKVLQIADVAANAMDTANSPTAGEPR